MDKVNDIRNKEIIYHEWLYSNKKLFESGSWLQKPVKTVMDSFNLLDNKDDLTILDIGSGVGRNAIPLAQRLCDSKSRIICLDMLDMANLKLIENAIKYKVDKYIEAITTTIEYFDISSNKYDFVVAVSVLEHIESKEILIDKLSQISMNTKLGGVNCFILNTSVKETLMNEKYKIEPQFEINLATDEIYNLLDDIYSSWEVIKKDRKSVV